MKTKQHVSCNLKIAALGDLKESNVQLESNSRYTLTIDYPIENTHVAIIKTGKKNMSYTSLLKRIGKEYEFIYNYKDKFGVWGHELDDLYLEQLYINHETKKITLAVGS